MFLGMCSHPIVVFQDQLKFRTGHVTRCYSKTFLLLLDQLFLYTDEILASEQLSSVSVYSVRNVFCVSAVRLSQLDLATKTCQYVNLTYTDPHYPNVTRNALVIRGPSRVSILST